MNIRRIKKYIRIWKKRGYENDIPDSVPNELMNLGIAPSYKAVCFAILRNDHNLETLGFVGKKSEWYSILKKIEINKRNEIPTRTPSKKT